MLRAIKDDPFSDQTRTADQGLPRPSPRPVGPWPANSWPWTLVDLSRSWLGQVGLPRIHHSPLPRKNLPSNSQAYHPQSRAWDWSHWRQWNHLARPWGLGRLKRVKIPPSLFGSKEWDLAIWSGGNGTKVVGVSKYGWMCAFECSKVILIQAYQPHLHKPLPLLFVPHGLVSLGH